MTDIITKLKVNDREYTIADSEARQAIEEINAIESLETILPAQVDTAFLRAKDTEGGMVKVPLNTIVTKAEYDFKTKIHNANGTVVNGLVVTYPDYVVQDGDTFKCRPNCDFYKDCTKFFVNNQIGAFTIDGVAASEAEEEAWLQGDLLEVTYHNGTFAAVNLSEKERQEVGEKNMYGVEWNINNSAPEVTRIGNMELHRTLPIHSMMRGCLLDNDGKVVKYLNPDDWTSETRDGSLGQVMIEIPEHYRKHETDGDMLRTKITTTPLRGYIRIPKMYISAYQASLNRTTQMLSSVRNFTEAYRGGNNNTAYDGTDHSLLGMPATNISRTNFRLFARNRGSVAWNQYTYEAHKALYWLFVVEYATRNSQAAFNAQLTAEGYHQGGLGDGVSTLAGGMWNTWNAYNPFIPCGYTDELGNGTGVVQFDMPDGYGQEKTLFVPRYRGIENPFGHIWQWTDGINIKVNPKVENGGNYLSEVYVCNDPNLYSDTGYDNHELVGAFNNGTQGYIRNIIFGKYGDILPSTATQGGGATQFYCDYYNAYDNNGATPIFRGVLFGGDAHNGSKGGLACSAANSAPSAAIANVGSRLCYLPEYA